MFRKLFKNKIAYEHYGKKWDKLTLQERLKLRLKFKDQFDYFRKK